VNTDRDTGHEYDGIREFDNPLPNWWLATFVITVVFGYAYWMHFHVARSGALQAAEYQAELAEAAKRDAQTKPVTDDLLVNLSHDPGTVDNGRGLFVTHCSACHLTGGEGKIGPNLTDAFWLHGGKPTDILKTVQGGVVEKGMPAWQPTLGSERVRALVAFVESRRNSNAPGGKEPQGVLVK
jgi:cytochrome c oxidase cbb3-type subunit 3